MLVEGMAVHEAAPPAAGAMQPARQHRQPPSLLPPAAAVAGAVVNVMKQNVINPPPVRGQEMSDDEKKQGANNILRGCFLAFLATFAGCAALYTVPDAVAAQLGRVMPLWFYEGQVGAGGKTGSRMQGRCCCVVSFGCAWRGGIG